MTPIFFHSAPAINKIAQHEDTIVICSSAVGGQPDELDGMLPQHPVLK